MLPTGSRRKENLTAENHKSYKNSTQNVNSEEYRWIDEPFLAVNFFSPNLALKVAILTFTASTAILTFLAVFSVDTSTRNAQGVSQLLIIAHITSNNEKT